MGREPKNERGGWERGTKKYCTFSQTKGIFCQLKRSLFESLEVILKTSPCFWKPIDNLLFDWHMTCRSQVLRKMFENNKHNSLHLALIFLLGHYLFLEAHNFSQASLSENNSLLGTCSGQLSDIISRQMEAIVYITPPKIP